MQPVVDGEQALAFERGVESVGSGVLLQCCQKVFGHLHGGAAGVGGGPAPVAARGLYLRQADGLHVPLRYQPLGMLHGGASVVLAETLGSLAANMAVGPDSYCVGLEVNANHLRAKREGVVTGRCAPLHLGATTQVWQIEIRDERGRLLCTSRLTMAVLKHKRDKDSGEA